MKSVAFVSLFVTVIIACGGGDAVMSAQKGHFKSAPKITLQEVIARYKYIDSTSIKWELVSDQNNNEFVSASMNFDEGNLIVFAALQEMILSGSIDVESAIFIADDFYKDILWNTAKWGTEIEGLGYTYTEGIFRWYFEPDIYEHKTYFNGKGGSLTIYFIPDPSEKNVYDIAETRLQFNLESPIYIEDELVEYSASIFPEKELVTRMLLDNIDLVKAAELLYN
jgi:hypothetical protein